MQVFEKCEGEYPRATQAAWRLYWDHQLVKLLNAQFLRDLHTLTDSLPITTVKLVWQNRTLALEPCLEDIRATHYRDHLTPFLSLPTQVRAFSGAHSQGGRGGGAGGAGGIFAGVLRENAAAIARCYAVTEGSLFAALRKKVEQYGEWTALGAVEDIDDCIDKQVCSTTARCARTGVVLDYER